MTVPGTTVRPLARLVTEPGDTPEAMKQIIARGGPGAAAVVVTPTPGSRSSLAVWSALMRALGADPDVQSSTRNAGVMFEQAVGRLIASGARDLVITRAHLTPAALLTQWIEAGAIAGMRVWLIAHVEYLRRNLADLVASKGLELVGFDTFLFEVPEAPPQEPVEEPSRFPEVPRTEFPLFLASCRELLDPADLGLVEPLFDETADRAGVLIGAGERSEAAIAAFLREQVRSSSSTDEVIVRTRATQVAAFRRGLHVQVRIEAVVASAEWAPPVAIGGLEVEVISALARNHYAAAAALAIVTSAGGEALSTLSLRDIYPNGRGVTIGGVTFQVPEGLRVVIASQRDTRLLQGAGLDDPLFTTSELVDARGSVRAPGKSVQRMLVEAAKETGLPISAAWTAHANAGDVGWAYRTGVSVQQIEEAIR